ncbi:MerR family transcriptional regulator [Saccharopolyspora erythraea]|uniref:MerR-family transcriptional regulator n=2 Tax=Saccharopolyspora erythraea TaxID=1836 RepID=A4FGI1_SACEN|nr:MerR family transcriptional regulator [Saccharopolyspora erythraea]EQD83847.1 MerR family transcriptional regulator [Saccharopolyspora erythraea D]QRK87098.1 MerR family transcriptional regulator [Saccharopolyspora erythraea]CAM03156.1 MerR-family transcriptional regulator [Saccharopolyspora erythraea NRRL 2338]
MAHSTPDLGIGQVAERTGLSIDALRFYEREGLLVSPVRRGSTGRRRYDERDVEWLVYCTKFRASGMPLATIRRFAELVRRGPGTEEDRLALLRRHREELVARISELTGCLDVIDHKIGVYEEHLERGAAHELWNTAVPAERAPSPGVSA